MPLYYPATQTIFINVKDAAYGAKIDGSTDDTTALAAAMSAANSAGGGTVFVPTGTLIAQTITLYSNVHLLGAGIEATIIKLKNSTNADLLSASTGSISLSASFGSGSTGGIHNWSIQNLTLDGNKANQSSGTSYPIRVYGYGYILQNLRVRNGYSGGILCDWNGGNTSPGQDSMEAQWSNVKVHDSNAIGIQIGGPHDSQWSNVISYANGSHNIHIAPNARGMRISNGRSYNPATAVSAVAWLIEANGCDFSNCEGSGSDFVQVAMIANNLTWSGGRIYANPAGSVVGVQLGQNAGNTPFSGQINQSAGSTTAIQCSNSLIETSIFDCQTGAINEVNVSANFLIIRAHQTSGSALASGGGYPGNSSTILLMVTGLTPDGSPGAGGLFQIANMTSYNGILAYDGSGNQVFTLNNYNAGFAVLGGRSFDGFSDGGSTKKLNMDMSTGNISASGQLADGQSASAPALATSGTINTANVGTARVAPTGNVTGVILQAGTVAGQIVTVVNESAFTVSFASVGTSNVADGTSAVVSANRAMFLKWDSSTSKWYHA